MNDTISRPLNTEGVAARIEDGVVVLAPANGSAFRRVVFVNLYGGIPVWEKIKAGEMPPHHLWGCIELARIGYEVALADPVWNFEYRRPFPHDLKLFRRVTDWLGRDGIVYCAHNVLFWIPLLKRLGVVRPRIVSLLYAREPLDFAGTHDAVIALTPAAEVQARLLAPRAKIAHLAWGVDPGYFPPLPYSPDFLLSCGITHRDYPTLSRAAAQSRARIRVICPGLPAELTWADNVDVVDGGAGWNFQKEVISYDTLLREYYGGSLGSLIILKEDSREYTACGFTNLLEAMAMARPVVVTRTGAVPSELDVEAEGCGIFVPPNDPRALAEAMDSLADDPARAHEMGARGRLLVESRYTINRFAIGLHELFSSL